MLSEEQLREYGVLVSSLRKRFREAALKCENERSQEDLDGAVN